VLNKGHFTNFAQNQLPWNVPKGIKRRCPNQENSRKYLSFAEKVMKIGPIDPEIALLMLKKKKLMQAKYIAFLASLLSGLNDF